MQTAILDNVTHASLRLRRGAGAEFGDPAGQVAVFLPELAQVQREYPILFTRDDSGIATPIAIIGLEPDEVLFVQEGTWDARYVPALVRKGPFLLGAAGSDDPVVHIILDHPKVTEDEEGSDPLFLRHGGNSPVLEEALEALRMIHTGLDATRHMSKALDDAGLIQPLALNVQISDSKAVKFDNFHAILPEAIQDLPADEAAKLHGAGFLAPAVLIAHSLGTLNDLVRRKRMRDG
ncbi:SapC family protein [Altererythrobacter sp.]|uniref:SapC family protein n=1 Tax=Altererythrobacter sp. TaxID=1872480 RepID=UPI003D05C69C